MNRENPIVYTPDNEPYLGRELLFHFDQIIISTLEHNSKVAPLTHDSELSDLQNMACQTIAQSLSIALSMRELIRQGFLFGAHVLERSLAERVTIMHYLYLHPEEIEKWNNGWAFRDAPGLAKMLEEIQIKLERDEFVKGHIITEKWNSIVHGKPDSAIWNFIFTEKGQLAHASSKIIDRPDLCDDLCANVIPWIAIVLSMMVSFFPDKENAQPEN